MLSKACSKSVNTYDRHKLRCTNSGAISGFDCSFYLTKYTEYIVFIGACTCLLLISRVNWTLIQRAADIRLGKDTFGRSVHSSHSWPTSNCRRLCCDRCCKHSIRWNARLTAMSGLIKFWYKCQRPSWNRLLKVTHGANLSYSYTIPSMPLV